ncbi:hypothetical protein RJ55_08468 [Drechmeria coniospora]|nr:hypothetical protein RJ55_08468 [Drechmeria coniospora]
MSSGSRADRPIVISDDSPSPPPSPRQTHIQRLVSISGLPLIANIATRSPSEEIKFCIWPPCLPCIRAALARPEGAEGFELCAVELNGTCCISCYNNGCQCLSCPAPVISVARRWAIALCASDQRGARRNRAATKLALENWDNERQV